MECPVVIKDRILLDGVEVKGLAGYKLETIKGSELKELTLSILVGNVDLLHEVDIIAASSDFIKY